MFRNALDLSDLNLSDHTTLGKQTNRGGYSDIFQGELLKGDERTKVAIKVLRVQGSGDSALTKERLHKRFHREVLLWKQLQHPNVVPLLGYMMLPDGSPALISPWYTNGNVIQYIGSQESPDRKSLALDVIRGLEYLHSISVAHGDLKGENVLVDASGRASLCDFGMSQFLEAAARITGFTTTNAHLGGTDRFMSPELFYELPKSTDTDIWALGCLIVQILTDEMPYHHIVRKQMITFAILRGDPPMSNSDSVIDEKLWGCIKDCWRMDPAQRPSASAMKSYFEPPEPPKNAGELLGIPGLLCGSMLSDLHHYTSWIEFSPDGRFLAAIGPSGDISILEVEKHRLKLLKTWSCADATNNLFIWKIAWSTSQRHLLVASHSCARIFLVETGELLGDIGSITAAAFFPNSPNIAFVQHRAQAEGTSQVALQYIKGAEGETSQCIVFSRSIVDLGFIDYKRVVLGSSGSFYVYNMKSGQVEAHIRTQGQLQMLSISKDGRFVLISYDHRDPEVWEVSIVQTDPGNWTTRLSFFHQYHSPKTNKGTGGCYTKMQFGGINDQLIIGLRIHRELNIWDRNTSALVHSISLTQLRSVWDMSFRWNSSNPRDIMLVLASCSILQIWSTSTSGTKEDKGVGSEGGSEEVSLTEIQESTASIDEEQQHHQADSKHPAPAQSSEYRCIQSFQHSSHHTSPLYQHLDPSQTLQLSLSRSEQSSTPRRLVSKSRIIGLPVYDPLFPRHILQIIDGDARPEHVNSQLYHPLHPFHISDPYQYRNVPMILPRNRKPPGFTYHGIPPHFLPYPFVDYPEMYDGFQGLKAPFFD